MKTRMKVLFRMSSRHLMSLRNMFVLIAVVLTAILFTAVTTIGVCIYDVFQQETFKQTNNKAHAVITNISDEQFEQLVVQSKFYQAIGYEKIVSDAILSKELISRNCIMVQTSQAAREMLYAEPTIGNSPSKKNEVAMDTILLELLGIVPELGTEISLQYEIQGQQFEDVFVLSGYWKANEISDLSMILVSDTFVDSKSQYLNSNTKNYYNSNHIYAYVMFNDANNVEYDVSVLLQTAGLEGIEYNINWAYMSNSIELDKSIILFVVFCIGGIIFTGYLLINNIFQISITNDMRYYGLMKVVGFTNKQIAQIVCTEACIIAIFGMVIGQIVGLWVGKGLLPYILSMTEITIETFSVNPSIVLFSSIFIFCTIGISITKPCRIIKNISPVEATNF